MSSDPDIELPRGIALAWGVAAEPQRGPKREMSVERIVDAAVELADAGGLGAVSMSAVAAKLGYTPMSLYRYVSAKDDLILLMSEEAIGEPPALPDEGTWRENLRALYDAQIHTYLRHPWLLDIAINGTPATPGSAAWMDAGLRALAGTPLSPEERLWVALLATGQARWAGMIMTGYSRAERQLQRGGDFSGQEDELFRTLITAEGYPDLRAAIDAGVFLSSSDPFAFGLERSLDGVAAHIDAVAAGQNRGAAPLPVLDDADISGDKRYQEARKAVRVAEKELRAARRLQREAARDARQRLRDS